MLATGTVVAAMAVVWAFDLGGARSRLIGGRSSGETGPTAEVSSPSSIGSVAALPTEIRGASDDLFLTTADSVTDHLFGVGDLVVRMAPTSGQIERFGDDFRLLASSLQVDGLLQSKVTAAVDSVVLQLQLVDAESLAIVWSWQEASAPGIFASLVDAAALAAGRALRPGRADPARGEPSLLTNPQARDQLRIGQYYSNLYNHTRDPDYFASALTALESAFEHDSGLASAAAEIAALHGFAAETESDSRTRAEAWARRALEIDASASKAWGTLAGLEFSRSDRDYNRSLRYALRAAAYGPGVELAQTTLAIALSEEAPGLAINAARRAVELEPLYLYGIIQVSDALDYLGRAAEALLMVRTEVLALERLDPGCSPKRRRRCSWAKEINWNRRLALSTCCHRRSSRLP